MCKLKILL